MTRLDVARYLITRGLSSVPGHVSIESVPCGLDVTVTIPPWRNVAAWHLVSELLVSSLNPQIDTRVRVVSSWSAALGSALFALAALGIAVAGVYVAVWL